MEAHLHFAQKEADLEPGSACKHQDQVWSIPKVPKQEQENCTKNGSVPVPLNAEA